ncbi:Glu/Leu/Phe/Val family dehydrogenase [Gelidibacter sp.]|uniref:Glu/Leu/Phe/Val family dehydrogenase n=1 Tax=Gelidibacter sp. TaxID=2018083 RepID=UPI002BEA432B|nr:Glu/Leu/Phe/Val dehydrogenase dimerization domain-containing protein [Gelidibacter sp.]HUH28413.1 Glu/Leu/Phe/Val dehydrogenase dimerization domain-containing protein [Gelidibacter sp.]
MDSKIISSKELSKADPVFGQISFDNHEQIVFCNDKDTGLKAIIGIHNTVLGPAIGGTRMWNYENEWEALNDVLRLSRGMTFKSAISGLNLGGGKTVIIGDAKTQKTPELMRKFGEFVNSLGGKYITAEDVGMTTQDMDTVREVTPHVVGVSETKGGSGNPALNTAYGVFMGMKAAAKFKYGSDVLEGKSVVVQGVGNVGEALIKHLLKEGALVTVSDINQERLENVVNTYDVSFYEGDDVYSQEMDIYAPCALGATINDATINKIKAQIIAVSANNQLAEERHGLILQEKGIVYAPDFLINAGGLINVYAEIEPCDKQETIRRTENIYNTTLEILKRAEENGVTPNVAALKIANERIQKRKIEQLK